VSKDSIQITFSLKSLIILAILALCSVVWIFSQINKNGEPTDNLAKKDSKSTLEITVTPTVSKVLEIYAIESEYGKNIVNIAKQVGVEIETDPFKKSFMRVLDSDEIYYESYSSDNIDYIQFVYKSGPDCNYGEDLTKYINNIKQRLRISIDLNKAEINNNRVLYYYPSGESIITIACSRIDNKLLVTISKLP
jgi:hypothetical protein